MLIVLMFEVFAGGVTGAIKKGLLWSGSDAFANKIWAAFWISAIMNLFFGSAFMTLHRITDTYIDLACGETNSMGNVKLSDVIARIDWQGLVSFVFLKPFPFLDTSPYDYVFITP